MRLTEKRINEAVRNAVNEFIGGTYNYPLGVDNPSEPSEDDGENEDFEYEHPLPTVKTLMYYATDVMDINDPNKLSIIQSVAEKLPETLYIYAWYEVQAEYRRGDDGYPDVEYDYDGAELEYLEACIKDTGGRFVSLPKWIDKNNITDDSNAKELIKSIADTISDDLKNCSPEDFDDSKEYSYIKDLDRSVESYELTNYNSSNGSGQNVMNESAMRKLIYDKVVKALTDYSNH